MAEDRDSFPIMEGQKDKKRPKILYYISKEVNLIKKTSFNMQKHRLNKSENIKMTAKPTDYH